MCKYGSVDLSGARILRRNPHQLQPRGWQIRKNSQSCAQPSLNRKRQGGEVRSVRSLFFPRLERCSVPCRKLRWRHIRESPATPFCGAWYYEALKSSEVSYVCVSPAQIKKERKNSLRAYKCKKDIPSKYGNRMGQADDDVIGMYNIASAPPQPLT